MRRLFYHPIESLTPAHLSMVSGCVKGLQIMCITFMFINVDEDRDLAPFRLILAMNRDEFLDRPTEIAQWKDCGNGNGILCGRDTEKGKEGGTWLAIDKRGRIGVLTNILTGYRERNGKRRGNIIIDYLKGNERAKDFLTGLADDKNVYRPFNILLLEPNSKNEFDIWHYTQGKSGHVVKTEPPKFFKSTKFISLGNDSMTMPFKKTSHGLQLFEETIVNHAHDKDFIEQLRIHVMNDTLKCLPDPQMELQAKSEVMKDNWKGLTSVFTDIAPIFATSVQTFITIDFEFNVNFVEVSRDGQRVEKRFKVKRSKGIFKEAFLRLKKTLLLHCI